MIRTTEQIGSLTIVTETREESDYAPRERKPSAFLKFMRSKLLSAIFSLMNLVFWGLLVVNADLTKTWGKAILVLFIIFLYNDLRNDLRSKK